MDLSTSDARETPLEAATLDALTRFTTWLKGYGYESHDQYDLWATAFGKTAKAMYYRYGKIAAPLVAPLVVGDLVAPSASRLLCRKRRFPIADAHFVSGFVAMYELTSDREYLSRACEIARHLLDTALPGYSGLCWGYPFDWQTKRGLWKQGTPFITSTPYVFDALVELHAATGDRSYLEAARSVAEFVARDIRHLPTRGRGKAASYTPVDDAWVINASAYRAACLARAWELFGDSEYRRLADENVLFILEQQRADGAWVYSASDPNDQFIDHFHTCFVLKGLLRVHAATQDATVLSSIRRGYEYYRHDLFYEDGTPRPFAPGFESQFRTRELYDYAEAINLHMLLRTMIPDAAATARFLVSEVVSRWVTPEGSFVTRHSRGGFVNRTPYHRWAQAQTFRSLGRWLAQEKSSSCAA